MKLKYLKGTHITAGETCTLPKEPQLPDLNPGPSSCEAARAVQLLHGEELLLYVLILWSLYLYNNLVLQLFHITGQCCLK